MEAPWVVDVKRWQLEKKVDLLEDGWLMDRYPALTIAKFSWSLVDLVGLWALLLPSEKEETTKRSRKYIVCQTGRSAASERQREA